MAAELSQKLGISVEEVRRKMIVLENMRKIMHVREGRFNWYFTTSDYRKYLTEHPEEKIREKLKSSGGELVGN